jgi:hypothetical protein
MRTVLFSALVLIATAATALADYDRSRDWFNGMSYQERIRTQFLLVFTGDYAAPVDGAFGPLTYQALTSFQTHREVTPDGVLDADQIRILRRDGLDLVRRVGFETWNEASLGLSLGVPSSLFEPPVRSGEGHRWRAHDNSITLETWRISRDIMDYEALFRQLSDAADGRVIEGKTFRNDHFTISGRQNGKDFLVRVMKTSRDSRGFSLSWNSRHAVFMDRVAVAMSNSLTAYTAKGDLLSRAE